MKLKPYVVTVSHDAGTTKIQVFTATAQAAIEAVMSYEKCPRRAILNVKEVK